MFACISVWGLKAIAWITAESRQISLDNFEVITFLVGGLFTLRFNVLLDYFIRHIFRVSVSELDRGVGKPCMLNVGAVATPTFQYPSWIVGLENKI